MGHHGSVVVVDGAVVVRVSGAPESSLKKRPRAAGCTDSTAISDVTQTVASALEEGLS